MTTALNTNSIVTLDPAMHRDRKTETVHRNIFDGLVTRKEMRAKRRTKGVAFPRQVAMYLARELKNKSPNFRRAQRNICLPLSAKACGT